MALHELATNITELFSPKTVKGFPRDGGVANGALNQLNQLAALCESREGKRRVFIAGFGTLFARVVIRAPGVKSTGGFRRLGCKRGVKMAWA